MHPFGVEDGAMKQTMYFQPCPVHSKALHSFVHVYSCMCNPAATAFLINYKLQLSIH